MSLTLIIKLLLLVKTDASLCSLSTSEKTVCQAKFQHVSQSKGSRRIFLWTFDVRYFLVMADIGTDQQRGKSVILHVYVCTCVCDGGQSAYHVTFYVGPSVGLLLRRQNISGNVDKFS